MKVSLTAPLLPSPVELGSVAILAMMRKAGQRRADRLFRFAPRKARPRTAREEGSPNPAAETRRRPQRSPATGISTKKLCGLTPTLLAILLVLSQ